MQILIFNTFLISDPKDLENDQPIALTATSPIKLKKESFMPSYIANTKQMPQSLMNSQYPPLKMQNKISLELSKKNSVDNPAVGPRSSQPLASSSEVASADGNFLLDTNYIEKIIYDHALNLLKKYKLKKLGYMFSNLKSFSMLKWLKKEMFVCTFFY